MEEGDLAGENLWRENPEAGVRGGTKPRARRETSEAEACGDWRSWRSKVVEGGELRGWNSWRSQVMKEDILEERHFRGELVEEKGHGGGFWTSEAVLRGGEKTRRWLGEGGDSGWSSWRTEVVEAVEVGGSRSWNSYGEGVRGEGKYAGRLFYRLEFVEVAHK